ncbi:MAG: helix-turn-helix domain-containing protein [Terriglobia bacterium]
MGEHDQKFLGRLADLVKTAGSKSTLARRAGIPVSSLQSYLAGSEPSRLALTALARAANVSLSWLATGEGERNPEAVPEGYLEVVSYDLSSTGPYLRGLIGLPSNRRLMKRSDLYMAEVSSGEIAAVEGCGELDFEPQIRGGDVFIFERPIWHSPIRQSFVDAWELRDDLIYLVADGINLRLRKLQKHKGSVNVIDSNGRIERTLRGSPPDVVLFGVVVWRGGIIASWPKTKH